MELIANNIRTLKVVYGYLVLDEGPF